MLIILVFGVEFQQIDRSDVREVFAVCQDRILVDGRQDVHYEHRGGKDHRQALKMLLQSVSHSEPSLSDADTSASVVQ